MTLLLQHDGPATDTLSGPSASIWSDCLAIEMIQDPGIGYHFFDDFHIGLGLTPTITTTIAHPPYTMFGGATGTVTYDDSVGGAIKVLTSASNEATNIEAESKSFQISASTGKFWFEARIKTTTIVTNETGWFIGLIEPITQSATVPLSATSVLTDNNWVGFHKPEANTTAFDATYRANSVAAVEVNSDIGVLVAGTYVKLGMKFDPGSGAEGTDQLVFYIDGVKQATTKTIPSNTGTDFPADVRMGPILALQGITAADQDLTMDWWRVAQLRTDG